MYCLTLKIGRFIATAVHVKEKLTYNWEIRQEKINNYNLIDHLSYCAQFLVELKAVANTIKPIQLLLWFLQLWEHRATADSLLGHFTSKGHSRR